MTDQYLDAAALAERFDGVKPMSGDYVVQCPVHEDRSPSLKISDGHKATVLHCHAGCSVDDILAQVGVTKAQLFHDYDTNGGTRRDVDQLLRQMVLRNQPPKLGPNVELGDIMWFALAEPNIAELSWQVWTEALAIAVSHWHWLMNLEYPEAMMYRTIVKDGPLFDFLEPYWMWLGRPDWQQMAAHAFKAMHRRYLEQRQLEKDLA